MTDVYSVDHQPWAWSECPLVGGPVYFSKCSGRNGSEMTCSPPSHLPRSINLQRFEQNGPHGAANQSPDFLHVGQVTWALRVVSFNDRQSTVCVSICFHERDVIFKNMLRFVEPGIRRRRIRADGAGSRDGSHRGGRKGFGQSDRFIMPDRVVVAFVGVAVIFVGQSNGGRPRLLTSSSCDFIDFFVGRLALRRVRHHALSGGAHFVPPG